MPASGASLPLEDLLDAHARQAPLAFGSTLAAAALLAIALLPAVPAATLALWTAGLAASFLARVALIAAWRRRPDRWPAERWLAAFRAMVVAHGLLWGSASVLLFVPGDVTRQTLLAFAVGGITLGSLSSTAFDRVAGLTFLTLAAAPLAVQLVVSGGSVSPALGGMFALLIAFAGLLGRRSHRQYVENSANRRAAAAETLARRDAELQLRAVNQDLERLVDARTSALRETQERVRATFDHSPVALTLFDPAAGRFADVNDAATRMFGYTREELLPLSPAELGAWDDPVRVAEARATLERDGRLTHWEASLRRKTGERFPAVLHFSDIRTGGVPLRLASIEDVTEQRELQERAMKAQKLQVVGQLAGGVAHDFNNVLTVITSTAELALLETPPGQPAHDALQTIQRTSARAAQLTARLLAFARQQILQPAPLDLNDVVGDLKAMVRGLAGAEVVVEVQPAPDPLTVVADRGSLDQVVLNLALNALDAMPRGGTLTLAVGVAEVANHARKGTSLAPGRYATLEVRDTGAGMTAAVRQRIFEPFFTTKDVGKGTGLGLAMAHGVVTQSGGEITVASAPDQGATFTVFLPVTTHRAARAVPALAVARGHEAVLVVDDDPDIRAMLIRALKSAGYTVLDAGSGAEALRRLADVDGAVDLLLTDVKMPGMGGRELADAARARYPSLRVLFSSGYAENAIADHGVLAEGIHFIAKPYTLQALTARIRDVLAA